MLLDARSLTESLRGPQTAVQGRTRRERVTFSADPRAAHSCRLLTCCRIPLPLLPPARPWWLAAPVARSTSDPAKPEPVAAEPDSVAKPAPRRRTRIGQSPTQTPDDTRLLDVLELDAVEHVGELVLDVRSWARSTRQPGLIPRLNAAAKVLGDLEAPVPAWVSAAEDVLEVAEASGMPDWGTPRALRELVLLALERDAFPERAVVRPRSRRPSGLAARLEAARREADARLTARSGRVLPKAPARPSESDRRAALSGWELRSRAA